MAQRTCYRTCHLCEAMCGVVIEVDGDRVVSVRGDDDDPLSRGYICPKAPALADLHRDPDRLRRPMRRDGDRWVEVGWDDAPAASTACRCAMAGTPSRRTSATPRCTTTAPRCSRRSSTARCARATATPR